MHSVLRYLPLLLLLGCGGGDSDTPDLSECAAFPGSNLVIAFDVTVPHS